MVNTLLSMTFAWLEKKPETRKDGGVFNPLRRQDHLAISWKEDKE